MSPKRVSGHIPRKRFGQHFLQDQAVIARIIDAIAPQVGDNMVEIGPGLGALTCPLLVAIGRLHVVELDRDTIPRLQQRCGNKGELFIHQADALKFDFSSLIATPRKKLRVVGNLPYNISSPLLFHLFEQRAHIQDMTFMLQKEVVARLAAKPGNRDYGRLSVMAQAVCQVDALFDVGPEAFEPPPKVNSAIVRLRPHEQPLFEFGDWQLFAHTVAQTFRQRRKTLRNALKGMIDATTMEELGIDPTSRPETLSLEEFAKLGRYATRLTKS